MMSQLPVDISKLKGRDLDKAILRAGLIAELDAISLYEQMAVMAEDEMVRKVLLEIAREEKTHVGELLALLLEVDPEMAEELEEGKAEVAELKGS